MELRKLMKCLQEVYEKHGDCDINFESNKHQYDNAKIVYTQEINEHGDSTQKVILSCFGKIK